MLKTLFAVARGAWRAGVSPVQKSMYSAMISRNTLLTQTPPLTPMLSLRRTFKTKSAVKKFCKDCYIVRRKGRIYVYCKSNGKHKQRQGH